MTLFATHDESGRITAATKHFDAEGYDKLLHDAGHKFLVIEKSPLIGSSEYYVDVPVKELRERPVLQCLVNKRQIKAGSDDSALIVGVPEAAKVRIIAVGQVLHEYDPIDADQIEISIPVPCTYTVTIDLWPYKPWKTDITAA